MTVAEPIIVVLGPWCGGTSAVAGVLRHLGVFMGTEFDWAVREPHDIWEELRLCYLCRKAFSEPAAQLQMDPGSFEAKLRRWADEHRRAAQMAGRRPGVKNPLLCVAVDFIRDAWGPVVLVVVDRPFAKVVGSLNRLGWWTDEQERAESTAHLIEARDLALGDDATVKVDFEELRTAPLVVVRRLVNELGLEVTEAQVEAAVESILRPVDVRERAASIDPQENARDILLARVNNAPEDTHWVYFLAQSYLFLGDFANAGHWYARRAEMGGWDEEVYLSLYRVANSMSKLGAPWPEVRAAYLKAWEFRPTRAESLYAIARHYREEQRYRLGYLFAKRAAALPFPDDDIILLSADICDWRTTDEQAVCASWIDKHAESFTLCRRLLARADIPDADRQRIAGNRDVCVPTMLDAASSYPDELVARLISGPGESDVVVSLVVGPDLPSTEQMLNSFLNCCLDVSRVRRFLAVDAGLSAEDRAMLHERYGFLEFAEPGPAQLTQIRALIDTRFWLHLGTGWKFFAPENLITRLTAVLDAEAEVLQAGINFTDAVKLTGASAAEDTVRRTPDAGRYVLADVLASGPAMFDTARLDQAGGVAATDPDPLAELGLRAAAAGMRAASLDEVLCVATV